jgi:hypothetical protein
MKVQLRMSYEMNRQLQADSGLLRTDGHTVRAQLCMGYIVQTI